MNKCTIIGNLTRDPELRSTTTGLQVCTFTVAVNRKKAQDQQQPEADFFRVTAWRELGVNCSKYLAKGRKVCVIGPVAVNTYTGQDGVTRANMEVTAQDVEFLTPRDQQGQQMPAGYAPQAPAYDPQSGYQQVQMDDGQLPF